MEGLSFYEMLRSIRRNLKMILALAIALALLAFLCNFFLVEDRYDAETSLLFGRPVSFSDQRDVPHYDDIYNDALINQRLMTTYNEILKSRTVLGRVIDELALDLSYERLEKRIGVTTVLNSEMIRLTATDRDPQRAADIANATARVFIEEVQDNHADGIRVLDEAIAPEEPNSSSTLLMTGAAFVFGLLIGAAVSIGKELADPLIRTEESFEENYGIPLLGTLPAKEK